MTEDVAPIPSNTTTRVSIADTIMAGHVIRYQQKSTPRKPVKPLPKPARPGGPKATDVKLSKRAARAHLRCLRRLGVVTGRVDQLAKPSRRRVLDLWREYAHQLPCESIARFRTFLDADEPPKPDQAYQYFVNLQKTKMKKRRASNLKQAKLSTFNRDGKRMAARSASVAFAVGIMERLSRPGEYELTNGMLRLSNIIFRNIAKIMKSNAYRCNCRKSKFLKEISDKIAVWIEEILIDSEDRMIMMDFDDDEDLLYLLGDAMQQDTASAKESVTKSEAPSVSSP
ncbi:uncharacterized protein LOC121730401 [Aricia agestis]|uniref:uncharacterized protein LOC121730401 n=1 Tax=Aricia agestis TaxID=91739 RepID=UPI001C201BA0|nr:uncharacterized protein LOC121730401 [Aricia agestis]XP_041975360.1 uncharacterized protein LOC121730401 [Aricia agestis]